MDCRLAGFAQGSEDGGNCDWHKIAGEQGGAGWFGGLREAMSCAV